MTSPQELDAIAVRATLQRIQREIDCALREQSPLPHIPRRLVLRHIVEALASARRSYHAVVHTGCASPDQERIFALLRADYAPDPSLDAIEQHVPLADAIVGRKAMSYEEAFGAFP